MTNLTKAQLRLLRHALADREGITWPFSGAEVNAGKALVSKGFMTKPDSWSRRLQLTDAGRAAAMEATP